MQLITPEAERKDVPFNAIKVYAAKSYRVSIQDIEILKVEPGYGAHVHDDACGYILGKTLSCMRNCDDSDWIVTVAYKCDDNHYTIDGYGGCPYPTHQAVYGVLDGQFSLWMD